MKLHHLQIRAIGPYAETVEIDFDRLDEAGVYLLTGPTGSGKTTVLDAVSYALFGEIPRAAKGIEVVSDHRKTATSPRVVLEATIGGERLKVTRSPEHLRPAARGTGTARQSQSLELKVHRNGEWQATEGSWKELGSELVERVGMNADQFGQVVMLPQGDFAKFLRATVNERKSLLEQLFPGADLASVESWLKQRAIADRQARESKQHEIADCFERVRPVVAALAESEAESGETPEETGRPDESPMKAEPAEAVGLLPELILSGPALDWVAATTGKLEGIDRQAEREQEQAARAAKEAEARLKQLTDRADLIAKRAEAERKKSELDGKSEWRGRAGREIEAAEKASGVRLLARSAREKLQAAERSAEALKEAETGIRTNQLTSQTSPEDLPDLEKTFRAKITTITNFENDELPRRRELHARLTGLKNELAELESGGPDSPVGRAEAKAKKDQEAAALLKSRLVEIRNARTAGMAAELAQTLEPGEPCVVCGSTEHPGPAHGDLLQYTREDEQEAEVAAGRADIAASNSKAELASARTESEQKQRAARRQIDESSESLAKLSTRESELADGAATIGERREELEKASELIVTFLKAGELASNASEAAGQAEAAVADEAVKAGFDSVEAALEAAREESDLAELKEKVGRHDQAVAIVAERLAGELAGIDPDEEIDLDPARAAATEAGSIRDRKTAAAGVARNNLTTFVRETDPVAGLYDELIPLREAAAHSDELSRLTNGDNDRKMKLSIYVLATRLRQVIAEANFHLQRMTDQRYHLVHSHGLVGNGASSGLGIEVHDALTSKVRSTATLSGGESFCASLSLALGLAEIVQRESGGKGLETLFIDEGFGTLDSKSLEDVMNVVDSLRDGGRSVGLVSHVEELRNRIPAQIQVESGTNGSTLAVTTG